MLLNFEAVDYRCQVFVNGESVGKHQGGHTPFSFDITDALHGGQNELIVRVEDETEGWQLRGKQVLDARGIWYTQVSGIWQTVWLERVASSYLEDLTITTDADTGMINVRPEIAGDRRARTVQIVVQDNGKVVAETKGDARDLSVTIEDAKLWSPDSPHLYDLEVTLLDADGNAVDRVQSYAGIRTVDKQRDQQGHLRFTLNGKPVLSLGPAGPGVVARWPTDSAVGQSDAV